MYLFPINRLEMLAHLPKNLTGVEIGVAKGDFSHEVLTKTQPACLHLIDPWEFQTRDDYADDFNNANDDEQELRFQYVSKRFAPFIRNGRMHIHRDYSQNVADKFQDQSLDWIYIDGLHSYDGVKSDLETYHNKVKENGIIMGHDYTNNNDALQMGFGVVDAVNEFINEYDYKMLLMTWETFPTFVLCKDPQKGIAQHLLFKALSGVRNAIHLPDYPENMSYLHQTGTIGEEKFYVPSFRIKSDKPNENDA